MTKPKISKLKKNSKELSKVGDLMKGLLQGDKGSNDFSNMGIILDKYINLRNLLESYIRNIVELLIKVDNSHLYAQTGHFRRYITNEYKKYCKLNLKPYQNVLDITTLEPEKLRLLRDTYLDLRDSTIVMTSIMVAKNILSCKLDGKSLNKKGRYEEFCAMSFKGDIELRIFNHMEVGELKSLMDFDFCVLFNSGKISTKYNAEVKKQIFTVIISLCEIGRKIDKIKNSADIDVSELFPKLLEVIKSLKGQMRGCERAFGVIENSADIFEKNCNRYIRKATKTGNPMTMFSDFVEDIIKSHSGVDVDKAQTSVIGELKKVILEMRKKIDGMNIAGVPEDVKFLIKMADSVIEEYENNVDGNLPDVNEIKDRQREFRNIFIP